VLAGTVAAALPAAVAGLFPARWPLSAWSGPVVKYTSTGFSVWPGTRAAAVVLALTALACWLAPAPARVRVWVRAAALSAAVIAVASLPATAHLTGWTALAVPTAAAVTLLAVGAVQSGPGWMARGNIRHSDQALARVAVTLGTAAAASAALRSLGTPADTIAELTVLTVAFCASAALTRQTFGAALSTAGALASAAGLACAVPLALGWPARYAAFAALAVAVAAAGAATGLRRSRPAQSVVLDVGAVAVTLLCAGLTAGRRDEFALAAVAAALAASVTAWLRTGARRQLALIAAVCGVFGALTAQWQPLAAALLAPGRMITRAWQGEEVGYLVAGRSPGLALAVVVLAFCLASLATAAGAWRGSGRASLDAVALALPVVAAPAGVAGTARLAGGFGYWLTVGMLLALTLTLTGWAALGRSAAPRAAALVAATLTVGWALAAPLPTIVVLGWLTVGYSLAARYSKHAVVTVAAVGLSIVTAAGLVECVVLAAHGADWGAGLAVLGVAAAAQIAAAWLAGVSGPRGDAAGGVGIGIGAEVTGWLVAAIGVGQCVTRPAAASTALAVTGLICLGVAARPTRRGALWPASALLYAAWSCWLVAAGVSVVEPYTVPAAAMALAFGISWARRSAAVNSWLAVGPGLAIALLPSLAAVWIGPGWIRPALLGVVAAGVALAGARARKQAPLVMGIIVVMLDVGRALAPTVSLMAHVVPSWVPIAGLGAVLLWAGATYEARLRNLRAIRSSLTAMH